MPGMFLHRVSRIPVRLVKFCVLLISILGLCAQKAVAEPCVRLFIFTSPDCLHCASVKEENLQVITNRVDYRLEYRFFDIRDMVNYQKLVELEDRYGDTDNEMPVVFIGKHVLGGATELEAGLEKTIHEYAVAGGTDWPDGVPETQIETPDNKEPAFPEDITDHTSQATVPDREREKPVPVSSNNTSKSPAPVQQKTPTANTSPLLETPTSRPAQVKTPEVKASLPAAAPRPASKQPTEATQVPPRCYMAFFAAFGCKECERVTYLLQYLRHSYPVLTIKEFDLHDHRNKVLYEALAERYGIPTRKRLVPAAIFIGKEYFLQDDIKLRNVQAALARNQATSTDKPWEISSTELAAAKKRITSRFLSFGPFTVMAAGLVDGINPCAFTTLIFFISYLFYLGKKGRAILVIGFSFTLAIFLTYFLIGCGIFSFLKYLERYAFLSILLTWVIAGLAVLLGGISLLDYIKARRGQHHDIQLQLPRVVKQYIHRTVRQTMHTTAYALMAFVAGVIISVLELACTGQVYLPTISFVTSQPGLRQAGMIFLALYNLMFILPLVMVFILAYRGASSTRLAEWSKRHLAQVKLGTAILFIGLGILLFFTTRG